MKLLRFGKRGAEKPGALAADGTLRDLSGHIADIDQQAISPAGLANIAAIDLNTCPQIAPGERIGAPISQCGKFICIGLNYADHAAEAGLAVPPEPVIFMKATSAICGPNDPIIIPRGSVKTDWEVELAVVIGSHAKYVTQQDALKHVAGYSVANDVSERSFQIERAGQWTKGKSCDNFGPLGPYLVTADEIADPQNLTMELSVNGQKMQDGSTQTMVYGVAHLISYLSQLMSLHPGDVISTGTPPGVGMGKKPPQYLKKGDIVELSIEDLGKQRQEVIAD